MCDKAICLHLVVILYLKFLSDRWNRQRNVHCFIRWLYYNEVKFFHLRQRRHTWWIWFWREGYCGLICSECPVYIATQTGNEELKEQLARDYSTDTCKFEKNDMMCWGLSFYDRNKWKRCVWIVQCESVAWQKKVSHCAECKRLSMLTYRGLCADWKWSSKDFRRIS